MRKFIAFLLLLVIAFSCGPSANAQDKTVTRYLKSGFYYDLYNGTSARGDTLTPNQDSIAYVFVYQSPERISKVAVKVKYDLRSGADTTVNYQLDGKAFNDVSSYTSIISATTGADVNADNTVYNFEKDYSEAFLYDTTAVWPNPATTSTIDSVLYSATITPIDLSYRYFRVLLVLQGTSGLGTGLVVDEIEFKIYVE